MTTPSYFYTRPREKTGWFYSFRGEDYGPFPNYDLAQEDWDMRRRRAARITPPADTGGLPESAEDPSPPHLESYETSEFRDREDASEATRERNDRTA